VEWVLCESVFIATGGRRAYWHVSGGTPMQRQIVSLAACKRVNARVPPCSPRARRARPPPSALRRPPRPTAARACSSCIASPHCARRYGRAGMGL
jgi:hypothetical protein